MTRKAFTVDEANALVPELARVFEAIGEQRVRISATARRIEVLELLWGNAMRDTSNPDHAEFLSHRTTIEEAMSRIATTVDEGIRARGLRLPAGGLEEGLVDFPTLYRGRWIYLCWHVGESELTHWHETHEGFRGRHRITNEQRREMGRGDATSVDDSALDF